MPLPPSPVTYTCPACGWSRIVAPRSDVLMPGVDHFRACPACGHQPLETQAANTVQSTITDLSNYIKQLLR